MATEIDRELLTAIVATFLWGGPPGARPAAMFTATTGRGRGKSKLAQFVARLYGGAIDVSSKEDIGTIKSRLLSPGAQGKRIALLDNVKSTRFSWAELEAQVTADQISGKRLYVGEASRPNYLTWILTLNGASLSTDMAQRVVEIQLANPQYDDAWEESVAAFVASRQLDILAGVAAFLQRPAKRMQRHSRWAAWESGVLSKVDHPDDCLRMILNRRDAADVEEEEGQMIEDYFAGRLRGLGYDVEHDDVFIPTRIAAEWYNLATGDRRKTVGVTRTLKQAKDEGRLWRIVPARRGTTGARGFRWIGEHCLSDTPTDYGLGKRLAKDSPPGGAGSGGSSDDSDEF